MTRIVVPGPRFATDAERLVLGLLAGDRTSWAEVLSEDLAANRGLLARYPAAGRLHARDGAGELRSIRLRRAPFRVWYIVEGDTVTLVHLLHARQDVRRARPWDALPLIRRPPEGGPGSAAA